MGLFARTIFSSCKFKDMLHGTIYNEHLLRNTNLHCIRYDNDNDNKERNAKVAMKTWWGCAACAALFSKY